jgi:hypothetical protein
MDARSIARLHALGRAVVGGGLVVAPGLVGGGWVGSPADMRPGQALAIGLGARDVAIALGALGTVGSGRRARPWLLAGMLADLGDLVGTLKARDDLPPLAAPAVSAIAGGSVLLGAWLLAALD